MYETDTFKNTAQKQMSTIITLVDTYAILFEAEKKHGRVTF